MTTFRNAVRPALKPIYAAANEDAALTALTAFAESELRQKYPSAVAVFENAWDRFIPFLQFPPALRRVIYTTNATWSLNWLIAVEGVVAG